MLTKVLIGFVLVFMEHRPSCDRLVLPRRKNQGMEYVHNCISFTRTNTNYSAQHFHILFTLVTALQGAFEYSWSLFHAYSFPAWIIFYKYKYEPTSQGHIVTVGQFHYGS